LHPRRLFRREVWWWRDEGGHSLACAPKAKRERSGVSNEGHGGVQGRRGVGGLASTARCWNTITVAHGRSAPAQRDVGCVDFRERNVKCGAGAEVWRLIPCFALCYARGGVGSRALRSRFRVACWHLRHTQCRPTVGEWAGLRRACGQCIFHGHCNTEHARARRRTHSKGAWCADCAPPPRPGDDSRVCA
jgi:hypothetical protein